MDLILAEWESFAGTLAPAATGLSRTALRNSAEEILSAVADDMETPQTVAEQADKSKGLRDGESDVMLTATLHAGERLAAMFTLNQLVAEYRALRASVISRWIAELGNTAPQVEELTRFNEAIDQSLSEAIRSYDARLHQSRELFVAALAHDLRSPLGAIRSTADVLELVQIDDRTLHRAAQIIKDSSGKMATIIDDLLDFAQIRFEGTLPIERVPMDLGEACRAVAQELQAAHPAVDLRLQLAERLQGRWDAKRINQVLTNLIGNAISHGGRTPVKVTAEADQDDVRVTIRNGGRSIPPAERRAIFEPFVRIDQHEQRESIGPAGLGLGLYISHQIVAQHGGSIDVRSSDERGTTFVISLPRATAIG